MSNEHSSAIGSVIVAIVAIAAILFVALYATQMLSNQNEGIELTIPTIGTDNQGN